MNTISSVRRECGGWLVEGRTPAGLRLVVLDYGPRRRVVASVRWAKKEPPAGGSIPQAAATK